MTNEDFLSVQETISINKPDSVMTRENLPFHELPPLASGYFDFHPRQWDSLQVLHISLEITLEDRPHLIQVLAAHPNIEDLQFAERWGHAENVAVWLLPVEFLPRLRRLNGPGNLATTLLASPTKIPRPLEMIGRLVLGGFQVDALTRSHETRIIGLLSGISTLRHIYYRTDPNPQNANFALLELHRILGHSLQVLDVGVLTMGPNGLVSSILRPWGE